MQFSIQFILVALPARLFFWVALIWSVLNNGWSHLVLNSGYIGQPMTNRCSFSNSHRSSASPSFWLLQTHITPCWSNVGAKDDAHGRFDGFWFRFTIIADPPKPICCFVIVCVCCSVMFAVFVTQCSKNKRTLLTTHNCTFKKVCVASCKTSF